jgi:hypothetical protein
VRHGGNIASSLTSDEAEFFLEFAATAIVYTTRKVNPGNHVLDAFIAGDGLRQRLNSNL